MATTRVTPDQDTIISEIDIAAPPERVFRSLCDAAEVRRRSPELSAYEMDARVGGRWFLEMRLPQPYHGVTVIRHDGEVLEVDPPRLLVHTWKANFHKDPNHVSTVRWELTSIPTGTHVKMTHSGLTAEPQAKKDYAGGWPGVLQQLKDYIEKPNK